MFSKQTVNYPSRIGDYVIRGILGRGGMGVVYEAWDEASNRFVALKTIQGTEPVSLYRFKLEYRQVAQIAHPNLVSLFGLTFIEGACYIVMELIRGSLLSHFVAQSHSDTMLDTIVATRTLSATDSPILSTPARQDYIAPLRLDVLNLAHQLARAICALHGGGVLHLDIKPNNIILTSGGELKLLDFGVSQLKTAQRGHTPLQQLGTPKYMAPECLSEQVQTAASDWYSFAVVILELVTGRSAKELVILPDDKGMFEKQVSTILHQHLHKALIAILARALSPDPHDRPTGKEVLAAFDANDAFLATTDVSDEARVFVGREKDLEMLNEAFCTHTGGQHQLVCVEGSPGIGKTSLVEQFLNSLDNVVVLRGRCHERETVPFKALDMLIDDFAQYLSAVPPQIRCRYIVDGFQYLAILFPVLRGFVSHEKCDPNMDAMHCRALAMKALANSLSLLVNKQQVILFLDDIQWGDEDSAQLLVSFLEYLPEKCPFIILSKRTEVSEENRFAAVLEQFQHAPDCPVTFESITVNPLTPIQSTEMLEALLEDSQAAKSESAHDIVRISRGVPFLMEQLLHFGLQSDMDEIDGHAIIQLRLNELSPESREILSFVAIAGQPVKADTILSIVGDIHIDDFTFTCLRAQRLLVVQAGGHVQCFHDQIRESILSIECSALLKVRAGKLAAALAEDCKSDNAFLGQLFYQSGQTQRAIDCMIHAADEAELALAFGREADICHQVISWLPDSRQAEVYGLTERRAIALSRGGYGVQAAELFAELAKTDGLCDSERARLNGMAASQFMYGGHIEKGEDLFKPLLKKWRLPYPGSTKTAMLRIIWSIVVLEVRRRWLKKEKLSAEVSDPKIELVFSVANSLSNWDPIRGLYFSLLSLRLAINKKDLKRTVQGLNIYAFALSYGGTARHKKISSRIFEQASQLGESLTEPEYKMHRTLLEGVSLSIQSEYQASIEMIMHAEEQFSTKIFDAQNNAVIARTTATHIFWLMGRVHKIGELVPQWILDAKSRGDHFSLVELNMFMGVYHAANGEMEQGRGIINDAIASWPLAEFTYQHWVASKALIQIGLMTGNIEDTWVKLREDLRQAKRAGLFGSISVRTDYFFLHGRVALARAQHDPSMASKMLKVAEQDAKGLLKEIAHSARGYGYCLRAGIARIKGAEKASLDALASAENHFAKAQMELHQLMMKRCAVQKLSNKRTIEINEYISGLGIKDPALYQRIFYPE
ncbi:serine/threonine-protein kinase PknK [Pseudoalteromonas rubra]|uniref:serine/threonine-protein kinase n=1 Tax=Pseudoalteromonas rubra TaxID=43658 RepID=UPI002DB69B12|nr:protein kinase [Pseudoalteromonas rubra]MEC4087089.1 protein kinase [Pseudoalteromonas rubra]